MALAATMLMGMLIGVVTAPGPVAAKNTVDVNHRKKVITITVNVDLVEATADYADYLRESFTEYWGDANAFEYRCYDVKIELDIKRFPSGQLPADNAPRHRIIVDHIQPGDPYLANVRFSPHSPSGEMRISDYSMPPTIAHEVGHLLFLPDEYIWDPAVHDLDGDRTRDPDEPGMPNPAFPDVESSLMGDREGVILQRHIDAIIDRLVPRGSLDCKWQGTLDYTLTGRGNTAGATGTNIHVIAMTVNVTGDDAGVVTGTADATITYVGEGTLDCGSWSSTMDPITAQLDVFGQYSDESMTLRFENIGPIEGAVTQTTCSNSFTYTSDMWESVVGLAEWTATAEGNNYVLDQTQTHETVTPGTSGESHIVIFLEPVNDEGEPVG